MKNTVHIFNIQHFSLQDGPGIRTVVFFKGCPLNCIWCHNPESKSVKNELSYLKDKCMGCQTCVHVCPRGVHSFADGVHRLDRNNCDLCERCTDVCMASALEIIGKGYTVEAVMAELEKDHIFFGTDGGVTFSGGEPFAQFDVLYTLLKECRKKGYTTCIETSGYAKTEDIVRSAQYTDCFLFDCKETDAARHKEYVGVDNKLILKNLAALNEINAAVVLRCPVIPGCNDRSSHFEAIAELAEQHACIKGVDLMPYHPLGISKSEQLGKDCAFKNRGFMDREALDRYCNALQARLRVPVKIR